MLGSKIINKGEGGGASIEMPDQMFVFPVKLYFKNLLFGGARTHV